MRTLLTLVLLASIGCASSEASRSTQRPCLSESSLPPIETEPSKQEELIGGFQELQRQVLIPKSILKSKADVRVVIEFIVDEQGCTRDYSLFEGTDQDLFRAGVDAIQQSAFVPAELNGDLVAVKVSLPLKILRR
jgi:hypothetical protein